MRWLAGTSGYSYTAWKGSFYPVDIAADAMLGYYASKLPAVEINNTFYRMPRIEVLDVWRQAVPDDFRFVIKAPRQITHQARLANCEGPVDYLASRLETLGDKLGCVLFQLPPYVRKNPERLDSFLTLWPSSFPAAVEFRHASWFDIETAKLLRAHGTCLCVSEDGKLPLPEHLTTTDWVYLRLRKPGYDNAALQSWLDRVAATGANQGFAFFKHEDAGTGPALARRFLDLTTGAQRGPHAAARHDHPPAQDIA